MGSILSSEKNNSKDPDVSSELDSEQRQNPEPTLYDILSVEPTVTETELKRAYKKHALRLHPDRNFQNIEEATKEFVKIQAAYDVLSDPQERAWYDSHTLHASSDTDGQDVNLAGSTILTTSDDLQKYFDPMLYSNIKLDEAEFYSSLGELFSKLANEERELAISFGETPVTWPLFGDQNSQWSTDTKLFYDRWISFSTIKDFYWCDVYRVSDAPEGKAKREMIGLNQRYRDLAKKEYNETVRSLCKFIKRRDPRVKLARAQAYEKQNTQNSDAKIQAARDRQNNKTKLQEKVYSEQDWAKTTERKHHTFHSDIPKTSDLESSDEEVINLFECLVCQKTFKTKQQYTEHEKSKKHVKALKQLKWKLKKDGVDVVGMEREDSSSQDTEKDSQCSDKDINKEQAIHTITPPTDSIETEIYSDNVLSVEADLDSSENSDSESEQVSLDTDIPDSRSSPKNTMFTVDDLLNEIESVGFKELHSNSNNTTEVFTDKPSKKEKRKRQSKK